MKQNNIYEDNIFHCYFPFNWLEEWIDAHAGFGSPPATYYII